MTANDPDILKETDAINQEFIIIEMDGLTENIV
jgi:hypothetical protein